MKAIREQMESLVRQNKISKKSMFGYPCYCVEKRMFACLTENGLGLKVPFENAQRLREEDKVKEFQPKGRAPMREWILFEDVVPQEILNLSVQYVTKK